jgi:hypothetical protein
MLSDPHLSIALHVIREILRHPLHLGKILHLFQDLQFSVAIKLQYIWALLSEVWKQPREDTNIMDRERSR